MRTHPCRLLNVAAVHLLALAALLPGADGRVASDEKALQEAGVALDGPALLDFFRQRTLSEDDRQRIVSLVAQLDSAKFSERRDATRRLIAFGPPALAPLRRATVDNSLEMTRRAEHCIREIEAATAIGLPAVAARLVQVRKPVGACAVLLAYLPFADSPAVEDAVAEVVGDLGVTEGKPDAALVAAARDPLAVRRLAAAAALARASEPEHRTTARGLLKDPELRVRLFAARALLRAQDKSAVPTVLALLTDAPLPIARQTDTLLCRVAGDRIPTVELSAADVSGRGTCRAAWADWWKANETKVDLAKLTRDDELPPELARLIERSTQIVRDSLANGNLDPLITERALTQAVMIAAVAQSGPRGADTTWRATLRDGALALASDIRERNVGAAQRRARTLPYLHADPEARPGKVTLLKGPTDVELVMRQFRLEKKGGLGIEVKIFKMAGDKKLQPAQELPAALLNDDLELIGLQVAQVAEIIREHQPVNPKKKEWPAKADELRSAAAALAEATKAKNGKAAFQALKRVETACYTCHEIFRDQ